jgi:acetyl esterase/lipase
METCYKNVGGARIMAAVHRPRTPARAAVVFIHGGALIWGSRKDIHPWLIRLLNDRGWEVISIDYRLAPSTPLPAIADDVRDAVSWAMDTHDQRVAVMGRSAGGYLALLSGTFPRKPRAIVSIYGYGSIREDWYLRPSPHYLSQPPVTGKEASASLQGEGVVTEAGEERWPFYLRCRQQGTWTRVVAGPQPSSWVRYCPADNVDSTFPPTFLVHGKNDSDVPFESSVGMAEALRGAGVFCDLELLEGLGHAFDQDIAEPAVARVYGRAVEFLARFLA